MPHEKSARPWFLYIIENKHGHLYTGITLDWERRFQEHSSNSVKCAKALKGKGPLTLKFCAQLEGQTSAMQAEIWLKKQSRTKKLQVILAKQLLPFPHQLLTFKATQKCL